MRAYLAVDLGTTELKGGLVAPDGTLLASARASYPLEVDAAAGRAEQDPAVWWGALGDVVGHLRTTAPDVDVIAVTAGGQGPTTVACDESGHPTRPALTWMDGRTQDAADRLTETTGYAGWRLGAMPGGLRTELVEPDVAARTRWYMNAWEWLGLRLTGRAATTVAHGQVVHDPATVEAAGLPARKVPPIIATGDVLGTLTPGAAGDLGLEPGTPVVAGCVDAFMAVFGAGLVGPGDAMDTGGTSGGFGVYWDAEVEVPGGYGTAAPLPGMWLYGGAMNATGKALDWLRDDVVDGGFTTQDLIAEAAETPPGAAGLVFLPYLAGERSPIWDPTARGVFAGLTLDHRRAHLVRAVLEAAALAIRHVAAPTRAVGIEVRELRVSGGPARSDVWNRIKADVLGVPVAVPAVVETAVLGAAVVAAVGVGDEPDLRAAMRRLVRIERRILPDPETAPTYDALFEAYTELHPAVAPIVRRLHRRLAVTSPGTTAGEGAERTAADD